MRVIAGLYKGRKLYAPKGTRTRPTSDRVKEAVFNTINVHVQNAIFLDLFAGSGGVGIEAISRGAAYCTFVETSKEAIVVIYKNIDNLKINQKKYTLIKADARKIVFQLSGIYDLIYLDPPYGYEFLVETILVLQKKMSDEGILIVETEVKQELEQTYGSLNLFKVAQYGNIKITYYRL